MGNKQYVLLKEKTSVYHQIWFLDNCFYKDVLKKLDDVTYFYLITTGDVRFHAV